MSKNRIVWTRNYNNCRGEVTIYKKDKGSQGCLKEMSKISSILLQCTIFRIERLSIIKYNYENPKGK